MFSYSRFEVLPDPFGGWIVWDTGEDNIAKVGTQTLYALTQDGAEAFSSLLNRRCRVALATVSESDSGRRVGGVTH